MTGFDDEVVEQAALKIVNRNNAYPATLEEAREYGGWPDAIADVKVALSALPPQPPSQIDQGLLAVWLHAFDADRDKDGVIITAWGAQGQRTRDAYRDIAGGCIEACSAASPAPDVGHRQAIDEISQLVFNWALPETNESTHEVAEKIYAIFATPRAPQPDVAKEIAAIREELDILGCQTIGLDDLESECCEVCRAKGYLSTLEAALGGKAGE